MKGKGWREIATKDDAMAHGLKQQEFEHLTESLGRPITMLELGICSALFSEHCSYKSTKVHLKNLPTTGEKVLIGPGENAGVIDIGDGDAVVFKIESHNHPSFIEPYQGAATGVGGILRDVFTMGARPIALMNSLRFGSPENPRTSYLLRRAVAGIGGYGNCMGIPTVGGELFFHEAFDGNCLVNAFALGVIRADRIFLGRASGIGNPVFYVGSKTGRDGIHGASMASEEFGDDSESKRPTVQVGDPFQEKLLLEACLQAMETGAVVGIQDMGAAGLTSSTYEMADRAQAGVRLHLDRVPMREEGMNPYELMLSESQERMIMVVEKGREREVIEVFAKWELDAVEVGEVIAGDAVELYWNGECVSSIPPAVLVRSVPQYRWPEQAPIDFQAGAAPLPGRSDVSRSELARRWTEMLASVNCCSRAPVYSQYDSTVRGNTVVHPGGDAAVVRVKRSRELEGPQGVTPVLAPAAADRQRREKGLAMTLDCNSRYSGIDPRQGTALSVAEACRNISAVGAQPIGISDNLNFGSPEKPEGMWQIAEGLRGLGEAARAFNVPIISGNVSLYNETRGKAILPTLTIAMVGLIEDATLSVGATFAGRGDRIIVLGATFEQDLGGSEYRAIYEGTSRGPLPLLNYDLEIKTNQLVRELIAARLLRSCHDLSAGGLAIGLAECCFTARGPVGARLEAPSFNGSPEGLLFAESGARFIISVARENEDQVLAKIAASGLPVTARGEVGGDSIAIEGGAAIALNEAYRGWRDGLEPLLRLAAA